MLTNIQWQEITTLWRSDERPTLRQLSEVYPASRTTLMNGLRKRGLSTKPTKKSRIATKCDCGCGVTIEVTEAHLRSSGRHFARTICYRKWLLTPEAQTARIAQRGTKLTVRETVPIAVRRHWPGDWCVLPRPGRLEVYRHPGERARVMAGTLVVPLIVVHT